MKKFTVEVLDNSFETIEADLCIMHHSGLVVLFYTEDMYGEPDKLVASYPSSRVIVKRVWHD